MPLTRVKFEGFETKTGRTLWAVGLPRDPEARNEIEKEFSDRCLKQVARQIAFPDIADTKELDRFLAGKSFALEGKGPFSTSATDGGLGRNGEGLRTWDPSGEMKKFRGYLDPRMVIHVVQGYDQLAGAVRQIEGTEFFGAHFVLDGRRAASLNLTAMLGTEAPLPLPARLLIFPVGTHTEMSLGNFAILYFNEGEGPTYREAKVMAGHAKGFELLESVDAVGIIEDGVSSSGFKINVPKGQSGHIIDEEAERIGDVAYLGRTSGEGNALYVSRDIARKTNMERRADLLILKQTSNRTSMPQEWTDPAARQPA